MKLGIFAKTFPGSNPKSVLQQLAASGFELVQYNMACSGLASMPNEISKVQATEVAEAASEHRLSIVGVSGTYNMIHPDMEERERGHQQLEVIASRCKTMGAPMISLCTGTRDPSDKWKAHSENQSKEAWQDLLVSMEIALEIAERYDVELGIEPELANVIGSAAAARRFLDEMQNPRLKIILDPANLFEIASPEEQARLLSEAVELLADNIAMAHAKDRSPSGEFEVAGKGVVDFDHFLSLLSDAGFDGPLVAHGLSAEDAPRVSSYLKTKLEENDLC